MLASPKLKTVQCISKLSTMSFAFLGSSVCILMSLPILPDHHIPVMVPRGVLNCGMLSMGAFLLHSIVVSAAESLTVDP